MDDKKHDELQEEVEKIEISEDERNSIIDSYLQGERYKQDCIINLSETRSIKYELVYPFMKDHKMVETIMRKIEKEHKESDKSMMYDNAVFPLALQVSKWQDKDFTNLGEMLYTEEAFRERLDFFTNKLIDPIFISVLNEIRRFNTKIDQVFNSESLKNF